MKLAIVVPTAEFSRQAEWFDHFNQLDKPTGTVLAQAHGQSPARNRNHLIELCLQNDCTHIFFVDDDVVLPKNTLNLLLENADKDIVTGLYLKRNFPHHPIIFDVSLAGGECGYHFLKDGENGLIPIVNCGLGCCLIRREVFDIMQPDCPPSGKKNPPTWIRLGECEVDHWCDDIGFFNRARTYGFKLWCDLRVQCGHFASVIVRPEYKDGKWMTSYDTNGEGRLEFNAVRPANVVNA